MRGGTRTGDIDRSDLETEIVDNDTTYHKALADVDVVEMWDQLGGII